MVEEKKKVLKSWIRSSKKQMYKLHIFLFFFFYYPPHLIYRESFVDEIIEESDPRPGK